MILWFLRLFPAFTDLQVRLLQAEHLAEMHSRRADAAEQTAAEHMQSAEAFQSHIEDLKRMVDGLSFRCDRRYVFGRNETPVVPESTPMPIMGRRFARDEVNKRTAEFLSAQGEAHKRAAEQEIETLRREAAELVTNG